MTFFHYQGKYAALHVLGLKQAALGASTMIPRAGNAASGAFYQQKLKQLATPAARQSGIPNATGAAPSLYAAMMGRARPGESGTSLAFRRHIMGQTPPVQQFAQTMPVPSAGMAQTMPAPALR